MKSAWTTGVIVTVAMIGSTVATQNQPGQNQSGQPAAAAAKSVGRGWPPVILKTAPRSIGFQLTARLCLAASSSIFIAAK